MENGNTLLFCSQSPITKRKSAFQFFGCLELILGGLIFLIYQQLLHSHPSANILKIVGIGASLLGLTILLFSGNTGKGNYLEVYSDKVTGCTYGTANAFTINYSKIMHVKKMNMLFGDLLTIVTPHGEYTVMVNDIERAYSVINNRLTELERKEN